MTHRQYGWREGAAICKGCGQEVPAFGGHDCPGPFSIRTEANAPAEHDDELRAAAIHLLEVGEFCRTDDTESALRRLRVALQAPAHDGGEK